MIVRLLHDQRINARSKKTDDVSNERVYASIRRLLSEGNEQTKEGPVEGIEGHGSHQDIFLDEVAGFFFNIFQQEHILRLGVS